MPVMVFCFAPEDANVMQYKPVPDFSFPDPQKLKNHKGWEHENDSKEAGESFSFVLTDSDSTRLYGFCRRYSTPAGPEVACILTRHPWYNVFCKMLAAVEAIASGVKGVYGVAALMKKIQVRGGARWRDEEFATRPGGSVTALGPDADGEADYLAVQQSCHALRLRPCSDFALVSLRMAG
eukprot:392536-Hanusia_phi.AAC.2